MVLPHVDSIYLYNAGLDLLYSSRSGYQQTPDSFEEQEIISRLYDKNFTDTYNGRPVPSVKDSAWIDCALESIFKKDDFNASFIKIDGTTYFQTHTSDNIYGWNLFNFTPAGILFHDVLMSALVCILILVVILIFTLMICRYLARQLNEPVKMLTRHLTGKQSDDMKRSTFEPKEFQMISSTISSLEENNRQLRSLQKETHYFLTQSFLNDLVLNHHTDPPTLTAQRLEQLNLGYLNKEQLCMAVFKIDNYQAFLAELASSEFTCNAFSLNNDKFVLLIDCNSEKDPIIFEDKLIGILQSIQKEIETLLHITMSVAYSKRFCKPEQLPVVYKNTENSLLLKMRFGHKAIIDPYKIDGVKAETFQPSDKLTAQLMEYMINGESEEAWAVYAELIRNLFCFDYNEIMSALILLVNNIYVHFLEKYPMLKDTATAALKTFLSALEYAEVSDDIQNLSKAFLETLCASVLKLKEDPARQKSSVITERILQIIEEHYADPSLCLSSIAETIGLSSNYAGQIFKQSTQKSVSQYLSEVRMEKVAFYLQTTSLPLNKILEKVGMEKNNYFYTRFKKHFGISLVEYRQKFQTSPEKE